LGASGSLAQLKIFPALFALFTQGFLPKNVRFWGFARSKLSQAEFKEKTMRQLTCRYTPKHSCQMHMEDFLERCHYFSGQYDSKEAFVALESHLQKDSNRLFYVALPPVVLPKLSKAIARAGLLENKQDKLWKRIVIEKPFGRDRDSFDKLNAQLLKEFSEEQIYRIDHYLGKEMVQNLMVLRFANQIFKPLWNYKYIDCVKIDWQENIGIEGRASYFDDYGIIRDVIQNHLLQIVTLIAMDEPKSLNANVIHESKLEVLRAIKKVSRKEILLGQYTKYTDEPQIPDDSITPTFAKLCLRINNERWQGVPFVIRAGKGLAKQKSEIHIIFRAPEANIFCELHKCPPVNELIIRIQPDEGITQVLQFVFLLNIMMQF
jgi:glucose-6-phosphate 1-dehydrogenase